MIVGLYNCHTASLEFREKLVEVLVLVLLAALEYRWLTVVSSVNSLLP